MNPLALSWLETGFRSVLHATWQGAVLALIVLALTRCLGQRLRANARFLLWLVVFARLAMPWVPAAPWSLYAFLPNFGMQDAKPAADAAKAARAQPGPLFARAIRPVGSPEIMGDDLSAGPASNMTWHAPGEDSRSLDRGTWLTYISLWQWLTSGWLVGVALMAARVVWLHARLARCRADWRPLANPVLPTLLEQCRAAARVRRPVKLQLASGDVGPATYGALVPAIVLPERLAAQLSRDELRLVLLHELIHVRRHDALIDLVAWGIACIHWFNPAAWLALARLRCERERACDAALLELLGTSARKDYGSVLLKAVETLESPSGLAGAVAMFELPLFSDSLSGRIHMIVNYRRMTWTARAMGSLLAVVLAGIGLTDAGARPARGPASKPAAEVLTVSSPGAVDEPIQTTSESPLTAELSADEPSPANSPTAEGTNSPTPPAAATPPEAGGSPRVRQSVLKAVAYLSGEQQDDGSWGKSGRGGYKCAMTSLCTLALLQAGVKPTDLRIRRAAEFLSTQQSTMTYEVGIHTVALCRIDPKGNAELIARNAKWLEDVQVHEGQNRGSWSYGVQPNASGRGDLSCTGFAIWGLDAAAWAGAPVKKETWERTLTYCINGQNPDGGWGYMDGRAQSPTTGSMTSSGLASLSLCLARSRDAKAAPSDAEAAPSDAEKQALQRGLGWLAANFAVDHNPPRGNAWVLYYLLMLRRACEATQTETLGDHNWRRELAEHLVRLQNPTTGHWSSAPGGDPVLDTAFVVLTIGEPAGAKASE